MKLVYALIVLNISLILKVGYSQDFLQTKLKADSLYKIQNYSMAETLYNRLYFFSDSSNLSSLTENYAICKLKLNKFEGAATIYEYASEFEKNDSIYYELLLKQTLCLILANKTEGAIKVLGEIRGTDSSLVCFRKACFLSGILEMNMYNYELANTYFNLCKPHFSQNDFDLFSIKNTLKKRNSRKFANENKVMFSYFIPGFDQIMLGDLKNSLNAFLINSVGVFSFLYIGNKYNYTTSILFFAPIITRFYLGNISSTKKIFKLKEEEVNKNYINNILPFYFKLN